MGGVTCHESLVEAVGLLDPSELHRDLAAGS
jgi:hypothetical protein